MQQGADPRHVDAVGEIVVFTAAGLAAFHDQQKIEQRGMLDHAADDVDDQLRLARRKRHAGDLAGVVQQHFLERQRPRLDEMVAGQRMQMDVGIDEAAAGVVVGEKMENAGLETAGDALRLLVLLVQQGDLEFRRVAFADEQVEIVDAGQGLVDIEVGFPVAETGSLTMGLFEQRRDFSQWLDIGCKGFVGLLLCCDH